VFENGQRPNRNEPMPDWLAPCWGRVAKNKSTADRFLHEVDSSSVFWNASTRLADGGQYGFSFLTARTPDQA